ncbi:MAG: PAS domain-containing protein, partial [Spirochaetota bacterium]
MKELNYNDVSLFFDISPIAMLIDCNGTIERINENCIRLLGGDFSDEFIGYSTLNFIPETDKGYFKNLLKNQEEDFNEKFEQRIQRLENDIIFVELTVKPILYEGKRAGLISIYDISKHKKLEQEAIENENRFRVIFEKSPDAVVLFRNNTIILANKSCLNLIDETRIENIIGRSIFDFIHHNNQKISYERSKL